MGKDATRRRRRAEPHHQNIDLNIPGKTKIADHVYRVLESKTETTFLVSLPSDLIPVFYAGWMLNFSDQVWNWGNADPERGFGMAVVLL